MDDAALSALLDAAFAFACTRRVSEFVDVDRLLAAADDAAEPSRVARFVARFVAPLRVRALERLRASSLPLGVWLPEPVRDALAMMLAQPAPIPRALVDKVVADEHVRDSVRAMLQETLSSFIAKAFSVTPGGRGLRGMIGFGAQRRGRALRRHRRGDPAPARGARARLRRRRRGDDAEERGAAADQRRDGAPPRQAAARGVPRAARGSRSRSSRAS